VTSGLRQTRCLVIKPKRPGAPLSCLDRSGAPAVKDWGRWVGLSVVYLLSAAIVAAAIAFLSVRAFSREALLGKPTKEYSNGKH
jgi:hypothetical protein